MAARTLPPPTAAPALGPEVREGELGLLLGPGAAGLLDAVAEAAGGALGPWRPRNVDHRPGRSTLVQYRADVRWPGGRTTSETFVAATGARIPARGAAVFDDGATRVAVWRSPADPYLPGLQAALDPRRVAALLDELGVDGGALQLRTRAYRPGRRAVVEATGRRGRLFLKVVPPHRVEALHGLHRSLAGALPVPDSLGWTGDGVLVLAARPGRTLREALRSGRHAAPPPAAVTGLLDRLPDVLAASPPRRDLLDAAGHHASVLAAVAPGCRPVLDSLLAGIEDGRPDGARPLEPVHGDLYESQLLVDDRGRISGLLDVDTAGAGLRADDLANFCAHLSVLALSSDRARHIKRYGAALLAHAEQHHDPADLRRRIAAAVLALATGPFRVLEAGWARSTRRRLDLAAEWLDGARPGPARPPV